MEPRQPTAGVLLAAGLSTRFGGPKQLQDIQGRTLVEICVDAALGSRLEEIVLVLGHGSASVRQKLGGRLENPRLKIVENPDYREGLSGSVRLGLSCVGRRFPSVMFLLADQPLIRPHHIDLLLQSYRDSGKDICVPFRRGRRGNPTLFSRRFYDQIGEMDGDSGGRGLIDSHPASVHRFETDDPAFFFDVDRPEDLERLRQYALEATDANTDSIPR